MALAQLASIGSNEEIVSKRSSLKLKQILEFSNVTQLVVVNGDYSEHGKEVQSQPLEHVR